MAHQQTKSTTLEKSLDASEFFADIDSPQHNNDNALESQANGSPGGQDAVAETESIANSANNPTYKNSYTEEHKDMDEDEEDRYWEKFQMPRRQHGFSETGKRARCASSSSSSSSSSTANTMFDDGAESDASGLEESADKDSQSLRRKRKLEKNQLQLDREHKSIKMSQFQEKRRRGRPRKGNPSSVSANKQEENDATEDKPKEAPRKPKGRVACQDPNKPDKAGRTKLFVFTGAGNLERVRELVSRGANVNFRDNAGWTPLHEASLKGQHDIAAYLISCGADVNARGFGDDTPLHDASSNGFPHCVKVLVEAGADVFALNTDKMTPLDVCDDLKSSMILKAKMELLERLVAQDSDGRTILHRACVSGDYDEVASLLKQGANTNAKDNCQATPLHEAALHGHANIAKLLVEHGADINSVTTDGSTALHNASRSNHEDIVKYLLDAGAEVDICNKDGQTPYNVTNSTDIRRLLAARIDELRKQRTASDAIDEITFLSQTRQQRRRPANNKADASAHLSREERKIQAIMRTFEALEQNKRSRRTKNQNTGGDDDDDDDHRDHATQTTRHRQRTGRRRRKSCSTDVESSRETSVDPDMRPAAPKKVDPTKLDPHKKDTSGRTHLHKWAIKGDVSVVETLLSIGANPNEKDNAGWTPLHEAALRGRDQVVELLLEKGADPNSKGADQDTPLHDATENGHLQVVLHLLKYGADPHACNAKGSTPLDIANENGNEAIEQALKKFIVKQGKRKATKTPLPRSESSAAKKLLSSEVQPACDADQSAQKKGSILDAKLECKEWMEENIPSASGSAATMKASDESERTEVNSTHDAKAHARQLSGKHLPKKSLYALHCGDPFGDGPRTPIPTPPPEHWQLRVKQEKEEGSIPSLLNGMPTQSISSPTLSEAGRYLPLYTARLYEETYHKNMFFVVDFQVCLLLGIAMDSFWRLYPNLFRRLVSAEEKDRLWSPLASMICPDGSLKDTKRRCFLDTKMYFVLLEELVSLIKNDYSHLSESLITITLDLGCSREDIKAAEQPAEPSSTLVTNTPSHTTGMPMRRPGFGLPPKFAMKLQKCGITKFDKSTMP